MSPQFEIIVAQPHHCGAMARKLRFEQQAAVLMLGLDTHRELRAAFDNSGFRRAWLLDGRLAGLGGVIGPLLAPTGAVWLALTEEATLWPLAIVREARRQLEEISKFKHGLTTWMLDGDETARRFALFLGFHAPGDCAAVSRIGRRDVLQAMTADRLPRIRVGRGSAVGLHYTGGF